MDPLSKLKYQIYLFQLENYSIGRYFGLAVRTIFNGKQQLRQELVWTSKLKTLVSVSSVLILATAGVLAWLLSNLFVLPIWTAAIVFVVILALLLYVTFIYLIMSQVIVYPLEAYLKNKIVSAATAKVATFKDLKVIGIAGSYGKTTAKEIISAVLSQKFRVLKTPDNINTPLGISELIKRELNENVDVFIVEMGEHERGDIRDICKIVNPGHAVITGINEAHLERMGNIGNTVAAVFELAENSTGTLLLNADDRLIVENYKKYTNGRNFSFYSAENSRLSQYKVTSKTFKQDASGYEFELEKSGQPVGKFRIKLLGEYAIGTIIASVILGDLLGIQASEIQKAVAQIMPVKHRLEPIINPIGTIVIDDSYNGNPDGVSEAINLLGKFTTRRKVYITPGLVEAGPSAREVHVSIGRQLGKVADIVILIDNSVSGYIKEGLSAVGFPEASTLVYKSTAEAHAALAGVVKKDDVVLFQNDWTDNYL